MRACQIADRRQAQRKQDTYSTANAEFSLSTCNVLLTFYKRRIRSIGFESPGTTLETPSLGVYLTNLYYNANAMPTFGRGNSQVYLRIIRV